MLFGCWGFRLGSLVPRDPAQPTSGRGTRGLAQPAPKIKFYISVVDSDKKVAEEKLAKIEKEFINYAENL